MLKAILRYIIRVCIGEGQRGGARCAFGAFPAWRAKKGITTPFHRNMLFLFGAVLEDFKRLSSLDVASKTRKTCFWMT